MQKKDKMVLAEIKRASEFYLTLNEQGREQYWKMLNALNNPAFKQAANDVARQQPAVHDRPAIVTLEGLQDIEDKAPPGKMRVWTDMDELARRFPATRSRVIKFNYDHLFPKTGSTGT